MDQDAGGEGGRRCHRDLLASRDDRLDDNMRRETSTVCPRFLAQVHAKMEQPFSEKRKTMGKAYLRENIRSSVLSNTDNFRMSTGLAGRGVQ